MRLGILSDNHGRLDPVREAVEIFDIHGVDAIAHCGDVGGIETLEILAGRPLWFVWGNTDCPDPNWRPILQAIGAPWPQGVPVRFELDGRQFALCHGHERVFDAECRAGTSDYVLHGHTHVYADNRSGRSRIINPGALHRARRKTIAILDISTDQLEYFTVSN